MRLALACALGAGGAAEARGGRNPAEITVTELRARREADLVLLDGRVTNTGERHADHVVLVIQFLAPGRQIVSVREMPLVEGRFEAGEEADFSLETASQPRVVEVRVEAKDRGGREYKVIRPGPYRIE